MKITEKGWIHLRTVWLLFATLSNLVAGFVWHGHAGLVIGGMLLMATIFHIIEEYA
jgi:hypothetical protein